MLSPMTGYEILQQLNLQAEFSLETYLPCCFSTVQVWIFHEIPFLRFGWFKVAHVLPGFAKVFHPKQHLKTTIYSKWSTVDIFNLGTGQLRVDCFTRTSKGGALRSWAAAGRAFARKKLSSLLLQNDPGAGNNSTNYWKYFLLQGHFGLFWISQVEPPWIGHGPQWSWTRKERYSRYSYRVVLQRLLGRSSRNHKGQSRVACEGNHWLRRMNCFLLGQHWMPNIVPTDSLPSLHAPYKCIAHQSWLVELICEASKFW